jgi:malonate-semialdehyde dehydrogenase (acetylating)/methylmalonate-semialdehyde dehydrogenase
VVGEAIAAHPGVDMVSFTGSTRAGRRVSELASATVKPVAMELGGKSPNVILDDADLERAVLDGVAKCFLNSGQTCSALTRMLVPRQRLAEAEELARAAAETFAPGDPFDSSTRLGPLVSEVQRERVRGYIRKGEDEGARLISGGAEPPQGLDRGYFVRPTVFSEVTPEMTIGQEEIFGPVLAITRVATYDEAIALVNKNPYANGVAIFTNDGGAARKFQHEVEVGMVGVNVPIPVPMAYYSFGGWKASLFGDLHIYGPDGVQFYTRMKAVTSRWPDPRHRGVDLGFPQNK